MSPLKKCLLVPVIVASVSLTSLSALAGGKKKDKDEGEELATPNPLRKVTLQEVGTLPFQMPNGEEADLSIELNRMLEQVVTDVPNLAPVDVESEDPCDTYITIDAGMTTLQMDVASAGVSFGYSNGEALEGGTELDGTAEVSIGTIAMDFAVKECKAGQCTAYAASYASHLVTGVELNFDINFGEVTTGTQLIYNTPLGDSLRKIMEKGMERVAESAGINDLVWRANVREYDPDMGTVIFDAGTKDHLNLGETFVVYEVTEATGVCDVYKSAAYLHTIQVDTVSSVGLVDEVLSSRGIEVGDIVLIRIAPESSN